MRVKNKSLNEKGDLHCRDFVSVTKTIRQAADSAGFLGNQDTYAGYLGITQGLLIFGINTIVTAIPIVYITNIIILKVFTGIL